MMAATTTAQQRAAAAAAQAAEAESRAAEAREAERRREQDSIRRDAAALAAELSVVINYLCDLQNRAREGGEGIGTEQCAASFSAIADQCRSVQGRLNSL